MEALEEKFQSKVFVTKECIEFCRGDPEATMAETNTALIEVGELKRKMQILRTVVEKLKSQTKQAEEIAKYMHERIETCENIHENLPKRLIVENGQSKASEKATKEVKSNEASQKSSKTSDNNGSVKSSQSIPKIRYLSVDEFEKVPKYMRGRLNYDAINASIDDFNSALEARYTFLGKGFQAMASMALKKRYKVSELFFS